MLKNKSHADDRLIAAYSDIAKVVELHTMDMVDGVMSMRKVDEGFVVPMGQSVVLKPNGFHLMFLDLQQKLMAGDQVSVILEFEHAGNIQHLFKVKPSTYRGDGGHKMHQGKSENKSDSHDHSHNH